MPLREKEKYEEAKPEVMEGDTSADKLVSDELVKVEGVIFSEKSCN